MISVTDYYCTSLIKDILLTSDSQVPTTALMRIAILHYHLYPGGVTRVIGSQVNALVDFAGSDALSVYAGDIRGHDLLSGNSFELFEEEVLGYLSKDTTYEKMQAVFKNIMLCLQKIAGTYDILHVHNLNLGKNPLLTLAVYHMAGTGMHVVNHCHDFAEDRPENYAFLQYVIQELYHENLQEVLYPSLENVHYIVLTTKDYERLAGYGIAKGRLNLVPNPVTLRTGKTQQITKKKVREILNIDPSLPICIYPVRAIHRKNIGEFILLSVLYRREASWLITQAPRNPEEKPEYMRWKNFCRDHSLPVVFEAGERIDIKDLMPASDFCVTTSMMEGFGLAYLEPWLNGIPVIGRNIESCTADMKQNGFRFPLLYDRFVVSFRGEKKDFKDLDQQQQQQVIKEVMDKPELYDEMRTFNPFLDHFLKPVDEDIIRHNQRVIHEKYSPESYGRQIYGIYKKLSGRP